jgi:hypothetical protein
MFNLDTVGLIMAGFGGLTVLGVTQVVKSFLKATGVGAVLISFVISAGFTGYYFLVVAPPFVILPFAGYTLLVFATANGIFQATHTPTNPTP